MREISVVEKGEYKNSDRRKRDSGMCRKRDRVYLYSECIKLLGRLPSYQLEIVLKDLVRSTTVGQSGACKTRSLTERETQVLILVANGYSRGEISKSLGISPNTAARHIANTYGKLHISTVAEATIYAVSAGFISLTGDS